MNNIGVQSRSAAATPNAPGGGGAGASAAQAFIERIVLSRASELARAGRYREAEDSLAPKGPADEPSAARFDLLARICAQQGRYREARAHWEAAIRTDPGIDGCKAALHRLSQRERLPRWWPRTRTPAYAGILLLVFGLAAFAVRDYTNRARPSVETTLTAAGVTVTHARGESVVRFDAGLFSRGVEFAPGAKSLLTEVGTKLAASGSGFTVEVTGHASNSPVPPGGPHRDNYALGLARAVAVVEHLRVTTGLLHEVFRIRSLGAEHAPYPNDTRTGRDKNKTVTIRIHRPGR